MISVLTLRFQGFRLSLLVFVSQAPVIVRSSLKFTNAPELFPSRLNKYSTRLFDGPPSRP